MPARSIAIVMLLGASCSMRSAPVVAQDWGSPVWSDEFSGPLGAPIDPSKWTFEAGILKVNREVQYYCAPENTEHGCSSARPNAFLDGHGHLIIQAMRTSPSTAPSSGSWTSARMTTRASTQFQYGRVEARMALPAGAGLWPAFWALGSNIASAGWPDCGEVDYMENVPGDAGLGPTKTSSTLHGPGYSSKRGLRRDFTFPSGNVTGFHTYGAIWSPNMLQFYVDDPANVFDVETAADVPDGARWVFNHPFFLLLNLAVGGDGSWPGPPNAETPSPAVMTVDYVRVYRAAPVLSPKFKNAAQIAVKAPAGARNSAEVTISGTPGSGRVFLTCSTNAPEWRCTVTTGDPLNRNTVDFSKRGTATASVEVVRDRTGGVPRTGTLPGEYFVTVDAYTVSGAGNAPDASMPIPFTVN